MRNIASSLTHLCMALVVVFLGFTVANCSYPTSTQAAGSGLVEVRVSASSDDAVQTDPGDVDLKISSLTATPTSTPIVSRRLDQVTLVVPDQFPTIQEAITAAAPGDTIMVRSGIYYENVVIDKSILLTAETYDPSNPTHNATIIDGGGSLPGVIVVEIIRGVTPMPTVRGFVIQNGDDGISMRSDVIVEYNYFHLADDLIDTEKDGGGIIRGNVFFDAGDDAIDLDHITTPITIEDNRIYRSSNDGIEIRLQNSSAPASPVEVHIRNNEIIGSTQDGIQIIDYVEDPQNTNRVFIISGNLFARNLAGIGFMGNEQTNEDLSGADVVEWVWVYNNTFYDNFYGLSGGDNQVVFNNIIALGEVGASRVAGLAGDDSVVAYTLFDQYSQNTVDSTLGEGNLYDQDPQFEYLPSVGPDGVWDTPDDDYAGLVLQSTSPAIDAGVTFYQATSGKIMPQPELSDFFGSAPDLGWAEYIDPSQEPTTTPIYIPMIYNLSLLTWK